MNLFRSVTNGNNIKTFELDDLIGEEGGSLSQIAVDNRGGYGSAIIFITSNQLLG